MKDAFFSERFSKEMEAALGEDIRKQEFLNELELPGDIWNNNPTFIKCLFPNKTSGIRFNHFLRTLWEENKTSIKNGYVEQFDITFSLAPRLCEHRLCEYCPYGIIKNRRGSFEKLCHAAKGKICPVVLFSTGYKMICKGKNCLLVEKWTEKQ